MKLNKLLILGLATLLTVTTVSNANAYYSSNEKRNSNISVKELTLDNLFYAKYPYTTLRKAGYTDSQIRNKGYGYAEDTYGWKTYLTEGFDYSHIADSDAIYNTTSKIVATSSVNKYGGSRYLENVGIYYGGIYFNDTYLEQVGKSGKTYSSYFEFKGVKGNDYVLGFENYNGESWKRITATGDWQTIKVDNIKPRADYPYNIFVIYKGSPWTVGETVYYRNYFIYES